MPLDPYIVLNPIYNPDLPQKVIPVTPRTGDLYQIPAWGYLEEIEIRFLPPLANMDANNLWEVLIERLPKNSFQVFAKVRNVK